MTERAAANDVEREIVRAELCLALPELNLSAFKLILDHENAFGTCNPHLESTYMIESELECGLFRESWRDVAHTISESVAIPHDVLDSKGYLFRLHVTHILR